MGGKFISYYVTTHALEKMNQNVEEKVNMDTQIFGVYDELLSIIIFCFEWILLLPDFHAI